VNAGARVTQRYISSSCYHIAPTYDHNANEDLEQIS